MASERELAPEPRGRLINRSPALAERRAVQARSSDISAWSCASGASPLQLRAFDHAMLQLHEAIAVGNHDIYGDPLPPHLQKRSARDAKTADAHAVAQRGVGGSGGPLPHAAELQAAFGRHDLSGVRAHVGQRAAEANAALGAHGYTTGSDIAFARSPDLHLAAHEAAHVIQQRAGVSLSAGMGQVGDRYERHADEVADAVVQGRSAEGILDRMAGGPAIQRRALQLEENCTMDDGTAADCSSMNDPASQRRSEQGPAAEVQEERSMNGMEQFASWLGNRVLTAVPNPGSSLAGNFTARVSIDGVVFIIVLNMSARRSDGGTITLSTSINTGIGGGTADNNVNVQSASGLELSGVQANGNAIGMGISALIRNHMINMGDGILPDPVLIQLLTALGGFVGPVAGAADTVVRGVYGLFVDRTHIQNPGYHWLADMIWGEGFGRIACRVMGEGASVESRRGGAVEARGRTGEGRSRLSGSARHQVDQVRTGTCEGGELVEESHIENTTQVEVTSEFFNGRATLVWQPSTELTIRMRATLEGPQIATRICADALVEGLGQVSRHARGMRQQVPEMDQSLLSAAVASGFHGIPELELAGTQARAEVQLQMELLVREDGTGRLRFELISSNGMRDAGDGTLMRIEGSLNNAQSFDVPF